MTKRLVMWIHGAMILAYGALLCSGQAAFARDVPVAVSWSGTEPDFVALQTAGGTVEFQPNAATASFDGSIPVDGQSVEVRTILVTYGSQTYELFLKVNAFIDKVSFRLVHNPVISCSRRRIEANGETRNLTEALKAVLQLDQLLSIEADNDCGRLAGQAKRARYDRMIELTQHSKGLFQPNDKIKTEYLASVSARERRVAEARTNNYDRQTKGLEAVQLRVQRDAAIAERDYATASQINEVMIARTESDDELKSAYRAEGMTQHRLELDQSFLETKVEMAMQTGPESGAM